MIDYKHYNLLYNMGVATQPILPPFSTCYPTYLSFVPPCAPFTTPPPVPCNRPLEQYTEQEILELIEDFTKVFPEFRKDPHDPDIFIPLIHRLACMYPDLSCVAEPCERHKFYLLLGHYYTLQGTPIDSINTISSSSVGDVSISYDSTHTSRLSPFFSWLNKSPYGRELIALLKSKPGIIVV